MRILLFTLITLLAGWILPANGLHAQEYTQLGMDIDGEAAGDYSGRCVSISSDGNVVAIGAPGNDGNGDGSGHVRVYVWDGSGWVQRGSDIDGEAASDQSGFSVSLSSDGSILAIGATLNGGSASNAGHVRVYAWDGSSWVQRGGDIDGEARLDNSGNSVALSSDGSVLAIGADINSGNGSAAGHVRVYNSGPVAPAGGGGSGSVPSPGADGPIGIESTIPSDRQHRADSGM